MEAKLIVLPRAKTKPLSARVDAGLLAKARMRARRERITLTAIVEAALKAFVEAPEKK